MLFYQAIVAAAKTTGRKKAVAEKMLATADAIPDDQAGRYVLFRAVRKLAIEADSAEIGVRAASVGLAHASGWDGTGSVAWPRVGRRRLRIAGRVETASVSA